MFNCSFYRCPGGSNACPVRPTHRDRAGRQNQPITTAAPARQYLGTIIQRSLQLPEQDARTLTGHPRRQQTRSKALQLWAHVRECDHVLDALPRSKCMRHCRPQGPHWRRRERHTLCKKTPSSVTSSTVPNSVSTTGDHGVWAADVHHQVVAQRCKTNNTRTTN